RWGEDRAAEFLERQGYRIVCRNYQTRFGEIDLVAASGGFLSFVEVKLRKDASHGLAREFVTRSKQQKVILAARQYLQEHETSLQPRFDVAEVYAPKATKTEPGALVINHIENAFE
ncbi:MAG: YraN family protein, partial [Firmicutes bacterium]|nr:YraN family protein [Bacillota bacterium]